MLSSLVLLMPNCIAILWSIVEHLPSTARKHLMPAASTYGWHVRAEWVEQPRLIWSTFPVLQTPATMSIAA